MSVRCRVMTSRCRCLGSGPGWRTLGPKVGTIVTNLVSGDEKGEATNEHRARLDIKASKFLGDGIEYADGPELASTAPSGRTFSVSTLNEVP